MQCASLNEGLPGVFKIDATEESASVWYSSEASQLSDSPAEVLFHYVTGLGDVGSGLGYSTTVIQQRDSEGRLLDPAMLVVDWTRARMAISYIPFLRLNNLLVARTDYDCARLD